VQFLNVLIRQAHPGKGVPAYHIYEQKQRDARRYKQDEKISWPVLIDDLLGTTHQVYGGLADPTYLIDADGRVAFYNMWTYAPNLHLAIEELLRRGGRGVVRGGVDHVPHMGAPMIHGWRGIRRGQPQSYFDLERAAPGMGLMLRVGYLLRPLLEPWLIRSRPIPRTTKAVALGVLAAMGLAVFLMRERD
jgi:hypothetical protein